MNAPVKPDALNLGARPISAPEPIIRFERLGKTYAGRSGQQAVAALSGIDLAVPAGAIVGVIGRSGAGKSTLIRLVNGLERATAGRLVIEGEEVTALNEAGWRRRRREIGMIFQHFNLLSSRTVFDNVALPLEIAGTPKAAIADKVERLLALVGLADKHGRYPVELSGGQKQRVGIARALATDPKVLLCDEATSALDPETTKAILALLRDINRRLGLTILLITHEMEVIRSIADRVAVIDAGRIVEEGPVWSVFADPRSEVSRSLLSGMRPQLPEGLAARLSPTGNEAVLRLDVAGETARGSLLSDLATAVPGRFRILQGGIDHIQDQPVGTLFLSIPATDPDHVAKAIAFLRARAARVEVLGHVAGPV